MEKRREAKRKKFHEALLNLYHPPPPPPPPPLPPRLDEAESVEMLYRDTDLEFDPDGDYAKKESSLSSESDCGSMTLTRAQRKRIRKRKLKESSTVRRKVIGPLLPESHQEQGGRLSDGQKKPLDEKSLGHSANQMPDSC